MSTFKNHRSNFSRFCRIFNAFIKRLNLILTVFVWYRCILKVKSVSNLSCLTWVYLPPITTWRDENFKEEPKVSSRSSNSWIYVSGTVVSKTNKSGISEYCSLHPSASKLYLLTTVTGPFQVNVPLYFSALKRNIGLYWINQAEISSLLRKFKIFLIEDIFFAGL